MTSICPLPAPDAPRHYLQAELESLMLNDIETWRFVQRAALDGVWYWNLDAPQDEWMSPEFWHLLGIDPATRAHDPAAWQDLIFQEDLAVALENFHRHCADPSHLYDQVVRYRHADGHTVWVRCRGTAVRDAAGRPRRMLGTHTDVTALKLAEQAARTEAGKARFAYDELQSFAYSLAHDMKSPAATAARLIDAVLEDVPDLADEPADFLREARGTLHRMLALVDDVLDFATVAQHDDTRSRVPLEAVARGVVDELAGQIAAAGAEVVIAPLPEVCAVPRQMQILLYSLLDNALTYARPDTPPRVEIAAHPVGDDRVALTVSDNGIGIAPAHHARVFEMFSRLHRQEECAGSGLGLTLCKRIALFHGGTITLTSAPGAGTTFRVDLPAVPPARASA
jgi:PAS domain S-box-containing protein